jgi:hypothetical protein
MLEGRVAGPWVGECHRTWKTLAPSLGAKRLRLDIRGVTHIDAPGRQLLTEIHRETGADFLADTPMTKQIAEQAQGRIASDS